jgi:speckle-type POZ protein
LGDAVWAARAHAHICFLSRQRDLDGTLMWFPDGTNIIKSSDLTDGQFRGRHKGIMLRRELELFYLQDDRLTIQCDLTVITLTRLHQIGSETQMMAVPPSDIATHFRKHLEDNSGADVTFFVGQETFAAHKAVLAARSPVFMAELFGLTKKTDSDCITLEKMDAVVFRVLLHFIYTDELPSILDPRGHDYSAMMPQLLVAANRYGMDRLKAICKNALAKHLTVESVADSLHIAPQHGFQRLKDVCMEFIIGLNERESMVAVQAYAGLSRSHVRRCVDGYIA